MGSHNQGPPSKCTFLHRLQYLLALPGWGKDVSTWCSHSGSWGGQPLYCVTLGTEREKRTCFMLCPLRPWVLGHFSYMQREQQILAHPPCPGGEKGRCLSRSPQGCASECNNYILSAFFIPSKIFTFSLAFFAYSAQFQQQKAEVPGGDDPEPADMAPPTRRGDPTSPGSGPSVFWWHWLQCTGVGWGFGGWTRDRHSRVQALSWQALTRDPSGCVCCLGGEP